MRTPKIIPLAFLAACFIAGGCGTIDDPAILQNNTGYQAGNIYAQPPPALSTPALSPSLPILTSGLLLFGGHDHNVFLGCLNCSKYDSDSVWNIYGDYGSIYSDTSIWNRYGTFGSKYSDESPWNSYGQTPPVIVDHAGNFYGYFTANIYFQKRTTIKAMLQILDNYDTIIEDFDGFVNSLN